MSIRQSIPITADTCIEYSTPLKSISGGIHEELPTPNIWSVFPDCPFELFVDEQYEHGLQFRTWKTYGNAGAKNLLLKVSVQWIAEPKDITSINNIE